MESINTIQKVVLLVNERNSINARIDHLINSHLWTDDETDKLLAVYQDKLKEINNSLPLNPFK
jgi:hypothetical protein